jgi:hypothetical protein
MNFIKTIATFTVASLSASALAHHSHITIKTPTGTPGEQIQIVVGYLPDEAHMSLAADGTMLHDGEPFVLHLPGRIQTGALAGQLSGTGLSLTSDYFAATGLLSGGDFYYHIASVEPIKSPTCVMSIAHTDEETGDTHVEASTGAKGRELQSLYVGVGGHPHGQLCACSEEGLYRVTFVAWDGNGVYADSQPVTILVDAHDNPADIDQDGTVGAADLGALLSAWGTPAADLDGNGTTDAADMAILLSSWG